MIRLSPAKVNLGLRILRKRDDGFHDLHSIMVPVSFCDIIEINPMGHQDSGVEFSQTGIIPPIPEHENLCIRAFNLFYTHGNPGFIRMHLHKQIPVGAGLGGGSSNAATVLTMLNELSGKLFNNNELKQLASELGSDRPFFIHPSPMLMEGRGEKLSKLNIHFNGMFIVILNPGLHISTAQAYKKVNPHEKAYSLPELIRLPPDTWKKNIVNDFEFPLFSEHSELRDLKDKLYDAGAFYASMSGSGSSIYGIFNEPPQLPDILADTIIWKGEMKAFRQIQ